MTNVGADTVRSLLAGWRTSIRRTRADWPVVVAAGAVLLLAATLLAAGPIYASAVGQAGLHASLAEAPTADANIEVTARVAGAAAPGALSSLPELLRGELGQSDAVVVAMGESGTFALPGQPPDQVRDLTTLGFIDGLAESATLAAGRWPRTAPAGAPIEVAVLEPVAATLGLEVGDTLDLVNRVDPSWSLRATVAATYRPNDPTAPYWWADASLLDGVSITPEYRTFGPLMTTREDLLGRVGRQSIHLTWHAFPIVDAVAIGDVPALRMRMEQLPARVSEALPGGWPAAETGLPVLLGETERSLLVSQTGVYLLLVQFAILAGYAVVLTADLVVEHRRLDLALTRSRGASSLQVALLALPEALLLAVPSALIAPSLAAATLGLLNVVGPLPDIGLVIDPVVTTEAYVAAAVAAAACAALIVLPTVHAARSFGTERGATARPETRHLGQRFGLDLALVAIAAIGLWQLQLYGAPLTVTVRGALGIDPLLVAAPAIGILAGSVVALRIAPRLAGFGNILAARSRHVVGSLGARELARRPLRYARTALLIMLAVSIGVFSVAYSATWVASQGAQADFGVGADLRVIPGRQATALPGWSLGRAYSSIDGVTATMPVAREPVRFTRSSGGGELIALDARAAAKVVIGAGAVLATEMDGVLDVLIAAPPTLPVIQIPREARALALDVATHFELTTDQCDDLTGSCESVPVDPATAALTEVAPAITIRDSRGLFQRVQGARVPLVAGAQRLVVALAPDEPAKREVMEPTGAALDTPIELIGVEVILKLPAGASARGRLALDGVAASEAASRTWRAIDVGGPADWSATVRLFGDSQDLATTAATVGSDGVGRGAAVVIDPLAGESTLSFARAGIDDLGDSDLPAVVNPSFIKQLATEVGGRVLVRLIEGPRWLTIVGEIPSFPTTDPTRPIAIVDLASLSSWRFATDRLVQGVDEWWLAAEPGAAIGILADAPDGALAGARIVSRNRIREQLTTEPFAVSTIGALSFGVAVAAMFAVIGLIVSASVSARQRRVEFALLRALGLAPGQLSRWLWLENASVVALSMLAGTVLGALIGWLVLPFTTTSPIGTVPFPPVVVVMPWPSILLLEVVIAAVLVVTLTVLAATVRKARIGAVLRMGEDRV